MSEKIPFDEFPPLSKSDWIEQIIHDLKLKSFKELNWILDPGIELEAFYHDDSRPPEPEFALQGKKDWEIMVYLEGMDPSEIRDTLDHDICSFLITQPEQVPLFTNGSLHKNVNLHVLSLPAEMNEWEEALNTIQSEKIQIASLRIFDKPLVARASFDNPYRLDSNYIWISIVNDYDIWADNIAFELHRLCDSLDDLIALNDPSPFQVITSIQMDHHFLKEVIRIRVLRILLANIWSAYGLPEDTLPEIEAHIMVDEREEEYFTNIIHNTTLALSAIIGGVDRLMIRPFQTGNKTKDKLIYRVTRNIHHILKLESYMDKIQEPAAGSYLIEEGTHRLAGITWKKFQRMYQKEKRS